MYCYFQEQWRKFKVHLLQNWRTVFFFFKLLSILASSSGLMSYQFVQACGSSCGGLRKCVIWRRDPVPRAKPADPPGCVAFVALFKAFVGGQCILHSLACLCTHVVAYVADYVELFCYTVYIHIEHYCVTAPTAFVPCNLCTFTVYVLHCSKQSSPCDSVVDIAFKTILLLILLSYSTTSRRTWVDETWYYRQSGIHSGID